MLWVAGKPGTEGDNRSLRTGELHQPLRSTDGIQTVGNVDLVKIPTSSFHNFKYPSWVFHQWLKCAFLLGHNVVTSKSVFFLSIYFGRMQIILNFLCLPSSLFPFCSTANERQAVVIPTAQWRLVITSYARERHTVSNATATLKLTSAIDKVISVAVGVWPDESGEFT